MNDLLTKKVIGAAFKVYNTLGFGFLESVYEKSMSIELNLGGVVHVRQAAIQVNYRENCVGNFVADLLIEDLLIVELKSAAQLAPPHEVQMVNYLSATGKDHGLLINFGPEKVEVKRKFRVFRPKRSGEEGIK